MNTKDIAKKILKKISSIYKKHSIAVESKVDLTGPKPDAVNHKLNLDGLLNKKKNLETRSKFSNLNEELVIKKFLNLLSINNKYCVDIAASDGITMSNTLFLFKENWCGIAAEFDSKMFSELAFLYKEFDDVNLIKAKITPENIVSMLKFCSCPKNFSFLNFDIDSYDYFVLDKLLLEFRPSLICAEINEKIPPPNFIYRKI